MFSELFGKGVKKPSKGDAIAVDGSNFALFEELLTDVSEKDQAKHREANAVAMEKLGYSAKTVALMRNPQPVPSAN